MEVTQLLRDAGLTVNAAMCKLFMRVGKHLEYIIGEGVGTVAIGTPHRFDFKESNILLE